MIVNKERERHLISTGDPLHSPSHFGPSMTPTSFVRATRFKFHSLCTSSAGLELELVHFSPKTGIRKAGAFDILSGPYLRSLFVGFCRVSMIVEDGGLGLGLCQKHRLQIGCKCLVSLGLPACRFCILIPYMHVLLLRRLEERTSDLWSI